jgi:AraC family transcriptional regulator, exoenzyme S synthesis regulatory protein ExsA
MELYHLPGEFFKDGAAVNDPLIFRHFQSDRPVFKGKSVLHMSAISLVITGTKSMTFADRTVQVNAEEFHFLSVGNCIVTMDLPERRLFESILIFFDDSLLAAFHAKYAEQIRALREKYPIGAQPYVAIKKDEFIRHYIAGLRLLCQAPGGIPEEMKALKFEELLVYLLRNYPQQLVAFPIRKGKSLDDHSIRIAVETNMTGNTSLEELAFLCNLSLSTFKRRFVQIYGQPPGRWLLQKRMELARELILQKGERPGEVYDKVGYENHSSFSQAFRQYFGKAPSQLVETE